MFPRMPAGACMEHLSASLICSIVSRARYVEIYCTRGVQWNLAIPSPEFQPPLYCSY